MVQQYVVYSYKTISNHYYEHFFFAKKQYKANSHKH